MNNKEIERIYQKAKKHYEDAFVNIPVNEEMRCSLFAEDAISDVIPGYHADLLDFGSYTKDNFAVLFVDMRNSTSRAKKIGPNQTFLTMHIFIPSMLEVVKYYEGKVIDIMGDGLMVFFGGSKQEDNDLVKAEAISYAGKCGLAMLEVNEKVVNRLLKEKEIEQPNVSIGVGVDYGDVIVTKIGINDMYDVKAFGDCVNTASKYSNLAGKMKVSKTIKNGWPTMKGGNLIFSMEHSDGGYVVERKNY